MGIGEYAEVTFVGRIDIVDQLLRDYGDFNTDKRTDLYFTQLGAQNSDSNDIAGKSLHIKK